MFDRQEFIVHGSYFLPPTVFLKSMSQNPIRWSGVAVGMYFRSRFSCISADHFIIWFMTAFCFLTVFLAYLLLVEADVAAETSFKSMGTGALFPVVESVVFSSVASPWLTMVTPSATSTCIRSARYAKFVSSRLRSEYKQRHVFLEGSPNSMITIEIRWRVSFDHNLLINFQQFCPQLHSHG